MNADVNWREIARLACLLLATQALALPGLAQTEAQAPSQAPRAVQAIEPAPAWMQAMVSSPRWQAALQAHRAALARADFTQSNPNEWTPQFSWAQRRQQAQAGVSPSDTTREWSIGLARGMRSPGKAAAADEWSQRQRELADAELAQAWLQLGREALADAGEAILMAEQATLWRQHADNLDAQHRALQRRLELGDVARQEVVLADAARAQARSQATAAEQRAWGARLRWQARHPGQDVPAVTPLTRPQAADELEAILLRHPGQVWADRRAAALRAQARQADADRQTDPVVGVQFGRERSGAERVLGVSVSWPIGSAGREAQSRAQWAEAEAALADREESLRTLRSDLMRWRAEAERAQAIAEAAMQAQAQVEAAEGALQRGRELGQVPVSDVLTLQRQLIEQRQAAAQARVDAWLAQQRWRLEAGEPGLPGEATAEPRPPNAAR